MKRAGGFLALAVAFATIVAGCGTSTGSDNSSTPSTSGNSATSATPSDSGSKSGSSDKKVTLSILSWENENSMKPVIDGFTKKYPNITMDFQYAPPVKDYVEKLKTSLLTDSATDLFVMALENRDLIDGGYVMDLTNQPFMKGIAEGNKRTYSKDGKVYALSQSSWVGGIFYNKKLFAKAGITEEPKTWQEFIALNKKLKDAGIKPIMDNLQDAAVNMISGLFGAETYSKNNAFDSEVLAGKRTYAEGWKQPFNMFYNDMVKNDFITKDMLGLTTDQITSEFANERVAMVLGGPWSIQNYLKQNRALDFKMMPVPGSDANNGWYFGAPGIAYAVNSKTKNQDAALKFLDYLASPEGLEAYNKGTGQIITAAGYETKVHASLTDAYKGLLAGKQYLPMVEWRVQTEALRSQYLVSQQNMLLGKISPDEAAASLDKKYKEMGGK